MKSMKLIFLSIIFLFFISSNYEALAQTNLAHLFGIATQSSTGYWSWWATADRAIDGNTNGNYYSGSVTHTYNDYHAWWQVNLDNMHRLESIVLWNRTDNCWDRLTNFNVSVLNNSLTTVWSQNYYTGGGTFRPSMAIDLPDNIFGQFVKVQLNGTNFLHL
ncbi:MAG: discoidin domain-containing protein, partial [bacterium]|nr:discoidin domain-containing protein [bacterium]